MDTYPTPKTTGNVEQMVISENPPNYAANPISVSKMGETPRNMDPSPTKTKSTRKSGSPVPHLKMDQMIGKLK